MTFHQYTARDYVRIIVLCFLGVLLFAHGSLTLWSLHSQGTLFLLDTIIDFLGSVSEIIVGFFLIFLGFSPSGVEELFEWIPDSLYIH